jgi:hypothetical protein
MATRYQLGDVLLPEAESLATAIPKLIAQSKANQLNERRLNQESRRIGIAESKIEEDRAFKRQQARVSQQNHLQQLAFQKSQAEERAMNSMLSAAKTPSQQAMIYNQYGKYEMAAEVEAEGNKVEDQNTIVKNYWSESLGSSYKEAVIAGKSALSNIDITHPNYSSIAERTDEAYRESLNPYQDMMKDPAYKLQANILLAKGKMPNADIQGIFDQLDSMRKRYKKERYGESGDGDGDGDGEGEGKTVEEQAEELVSNLLTGDAFTPEGALDFDPETGADVKKIATGVESTSKVNIGTLLSSISKLENRKDILDRTAALRPLTKGQVKESEQISATLKAAKEELSKQKSSLGQAKRETELFKGISYSPLRG